MVLVTVWGCPWCLCHTCAPNTHSQMHTHIPPTATKNATIKKGHLFFLSSYLPLTGICSILSAFILYNMSSSCLCLLPCPPKPRNFYSCLTYRWGPGQQSLLSWCSASLLHCNFQCLIHFQIFKLYTSAAGSKVSVPPLAAVKSHISQLLALCVCCLGSSMRLSYIFFIQKPKWHVSKLK